MNLDFSYRVARFFSSGHVLPLTFGEGKNISIEANDRSADDHWKVVIYMPLAEAKRLAENLQHEISRAEEYPREAQA